MKYSTRPNLFRNWIVAFIDPSRLLSIIRFPRFLKHWFLYSHKAGYGSIRFRNSYPCLADWTPRTPVDPHYFYQACWAARKIHLYRPSIHVDVGSSVTIVGIVSAVIPTVFIDIRPLEAEVDGLECISGNILALPLKTGNIDSLSCLHVLEHIGLGRYGDKIDPEGHVKAAKELFRVLASGGHLLLSVPVGRERVQFNAHRVFSPRTIVSLFHPLVLEDFSFVDDDNKYFYGVNPEDAKACEYGCGMFCFRKME